MRIVLAVALATTAWTRADDPAPVPPPTPADLKVSEEPTPPTSFAEVRCPLQKGDTVDWEVSPAPKKLAVHVEKGTADVCTGVLYFNGPPGKYVVTALVINFETKKFSKKRREVTLGDKKPDEPKKPDDKKPDPPPTPDAALLKKVQDAYGADRGRPGDALQLGSLYREAAKIAVRKGADGKYVARSSNDLVAAVRLSSASLIDPNVLLGVRTVAATELATALGTQSDDDMTTAQREAAAVLYLRLAVCLDTFWK